jgi:hypothetical protein
VIDLADFIERLLHLGISGKASKLTGPWVPIPYPAPYVAPLTNSQMFYQVMGPALP